MKKLFKFLSLPIAITCCSMIPNNPSISFVAFGIVEEDPVEGTFKLEAYVDEYIRSTSKICTYTYGWVEGDGTLHKCGTSALGSLAAKSGVLLYGCNKIHYADLDACSPVTLVCDATVTGEATLRVSMPYNSKTIDAFEINESTNNQEFSTGYIKESTYLDESKNYHYEDTFSFINYEDLRVNEVYYDLDISYLRFKYRNGLDDALKGEFRFAFYDRYNLFPDFEIGESMYRYIPLKFNRSGDECYFTFDTTIYYDPVTHESSLIQKEGYLSYHNLMLPFNAAAELKFLPCYIELKVHSHSDFTITGSFMMTYLKKYFGDCEDSDFCDNIHQDDEVNVREKVIEVTI